MLFGKFSYYKLLILQRATRIRSMPFTGESSSDSDDEVPSDSVATGGESDAVVSVAGPSGVRNVNHSTGVGVRRQVGQSPSGAIKRGGWIHIKFSTHRVSKEYNLCNFQKNFPSPKMVAILNFRIFAKNGKTQICFYLLNRAR